MASASVMQYSQPAGGFHTQTYTPNNLFPRKSAASSSSYVGTVIPPPKAAVLPPQRSASTLFNAYQYQNGSSAPDAVVVPKLGSDHAKLHKRAGPRTSDPRSKEFEAQEQHYGISYVRSKTPPPNSVDPPLDGSKSPSSRSIAKDKLRHNLWKLGQQKEEVEQTDTIDLSRTAAENEELSGLGIVSSRTLTRSATDLRYSSGSGLRGHTRSMSYSSDIAGPFQPTAPYIHPMRRQSETDYTPAIGHSNTASLIGSEEAGAAFPTFQDDHNNRSRGVTIGSMASSGDRPRLQVNTSGSGHRFVSATQSMTSLNRTSTRPRRSTNQSCDTMSPRSRTSADRAFSFMSRTKEEPIDAITRVQSIQAARQAFEEREKAKARKYEKQELKAVERQNQKQAKQEERVRGKFGPQERGPIRSHPYSEKEELESVQEYYGVAPGGARAHRTGARSIPTSAPPSEFPAVSRKRAAKGRYFGFLTWLKTRFLNMGRQRRRSL